MDNKSILSKNNSSSAGHIIYDQNGSPMTARAKLQFTGGAVVTDNGSDTTIVTISASSSGAIYWKIPSGATVNVADNCQYPVYHRFVLEGKIVLGAGAQLVLYN